MLLSTAAGSVLDLVYPLAEVFTRVQVTEFKPFVTVVGQFLPWVKCEVSAPIYRENFSCFHPHPPINPLPPPLSESETAARLSRRQTSTRPSET